MGLDMYLRGERFLPTEIVDTDNGFPKTSETYRLGYWRKHPNLHGFIVQTFANGDDDCRPIELDEPHILFIIDAIQRRRLPHTTGCFFGRSECTAAEMQTDLGIFRRALVWLKADEPDVWKSVTYQASW